MCDRWIWITWERHRRTRELCNDLGVRLFERDVEITRLIRYPYLLLWTAYTIARIRPGGVIVQNPSIVLAVWATILKYLFRYALIVDAHNQGLRPIYQPLGRLQFLFRFVQAKADLTVVTNDFLVEGVKLNGGNPFVLPDKLPVFADVPSMKLKGRYSVLCISTFAKDEPVEDVIEAAAGLDSSDYRVYMTGNHRRLPRDVASRIPPNVILTGYLPEADYVASLKGADVILDLTHTDDCLVCGAYEAVAAGTPLIVTDTAALRSYFCKGTIYTKNTPSDIRQAIVIALGQATRLREEMIVLRNDLDERWQAQRDDLRRLMDALAGRGH
jgi:glycosyltransferase involved in cell wall biosynthesis